MKRNALLLTGIFVLLAIGYVGKHLYRTNLGGEHVSITGGITLPQVLESSPATKPGTCSVSAACKMTRKGMGSDLVSNLNQEYSLYVNEGGKLSAILMRGNVEQGGSSFYTATMLVITALDQDTYNLSYYGVVNTDKLAGSWNHPIVYASDPNEPLHWNDAKSWVAKKLDTITLTVERDGSIKIKPRG